MPERQSDNNRGLPPEERADVATDDFENEEEFPPSERGEILKLAVAALKQGADVPGRVQKGPTCGLYALGMVMDYWEQRDAASTTALVQESDDYRQNSHTLPADTHVRLLDLARERGYTTEGEMFHAKDLAALAISFGYRAVVHEDFTLDVLLEAVNRKRPCLAGFDVDDDGNPGQFGGKNAHWTVIESHFEKDGERFLVASHAWSGGEYVWRAEEFMRSASQLFHGDTSGYPKAPEDISNTLNRRLVEVYREGIVPVKPKRKRRRRR